MFTGIKDSDPFISIKCNVCSVTQLCPTLLQPHGLWPTRLLCPLDLPGKNTGAGCHFLLWGIFPFLWKATPKAKPWLVHLLLYTQNVWLTTSPAIGSMKTFGRKKPATIPTPSNHLMITQCESLPCVHMKPPPRSPQTESHMKEQLSQPRFLSWTLHLAIDLLLASPSPPHTS